MNCHVLVQSTLERKAFPTNITTKFYFTMTVTVAIQRGLSAEVSFTLRAFYNAMVFSMVGVKFSHRTEYPSTQSTSDFPCFRNRLHGFTGSSGPIGFHMQCQ